MFDLFKDITKYKGIPPYASEHYGIYQPLLGWASRLTKKWIQRDGVALDPRIKQILDGRVAPGPMSVQQDDPREFLAVPLQPGAGRSPYKVMLTKNLTSELMKLVLAKVQAFAEANGGALPAGQQWLQLINVNDLMDAQKGSLRQVNDLLRTRLFQSLQAQARGGLVSAEMNAAAKATHLQLMQYESQIATFLLGHAEAQGGLLPDDLAQLFVVQEAQPLDEILRSTDPLANIDPNDKSGALSPVGFVHLFRQYFFDLGTFLGEPVEHIWLTPGTTTELIEVSTRKTVIERSMEKSGETSTRSDSSVDTKDELSDAVKTETGSSTKLGVSTTQGVNFGVYQGTATASLGLESTRKDAREITVKNTRDTSEKLSSEIRNSFKSVFKTVTEDTDSRSRRYVLQNPGTELVNYELRRKMRRVGVQMQGLGERLCWQVFIDDAGSSLGLSELVHFAASPDLGSLKDPDAGPPPGPIAKTVSLPVPFQPFRSNDNSQVDYANNGLIEQGSQYKGMFRGNRSNTNSADESDYEIAMGPYHFTFAAPKSNHVLAEVRVVGPQGNKQAIVRGTPSITKADAGSFDVVFDFLNFGGANQLLFDVELVFTPGSDAFKEYEAAKAVAQAKFDADKQRLLQKTFVENVRKRIDDASNIKSRPSWELREEERTVIYRNLIEKLMLDSWGIAKKSPQDGSNARLSHVRSEVIRAIFDVDSMLYFVAPEWWMPRRHRSQYQGSADFQLTANDLVQWDDVEKRDDNYKITETSSAARLGSSLGWLLQLDGDNMRNAFLNAPWVKAVIPIRPGREQAALNWLRAIEGHENDGWDTPYTAITPEDATLLAELAAEGLPATIGNVLEKVARRLAKANGDIKGVLEADRVFEYGFDHLAGGFDASVDPSKPFSQWVTVLPTDQIVAVEYKPTDLLQP